MEKIVINGGKPLFGEITVSGMKNAAIPILFATILIEDKCIIENIPDIMDVKNALEILKAMGVKIKKLTHSTYEIDSTTVVPLSAPDEFVQKMRASYYVLGAELGRFGCSRIAQTGGCDLGARPIDQHIKGFEALGAEVNQSENQILLTTKKKIKGASVYMDVVSVGATINIMLASVKAEGTTIIENAAHEPHIVDTANFLNACGAQISGAGTDVIKIKGVQKFHGASYAIIPDMIEAGTYMILAAATKGKLTIKNVIPKHLDSISAKLVEMGNKVEEGDDEITVSREGDMNPINVKTLPYPGLPTDINPQICILLCLANGKSRLIEGVWSNRFRYVEELKRMGADINVTDSTATVTGVRELHGARVRAVDLRAGAAMVIAGLCADGRTEIDDIFHIQRGYENIIEKLTQVGADIKFVCE